MLCPFSMQIDYIYFFYGLAFLILAGVCASMWRADRDPLPWGWLALFGVAHGLNEWLDLLAVCGEDSYPFSLIRILMLTCSFGLLMQFGRIGTNRIRKRGPGGWIMLPLSLLALSGALEGLSGLNATTRYCLGVGGGIWTARALILTSRIVAPRHGPWLLAAGISFGIYALAAGTLVPETGFFPARLINQDAFHELLGVPVQLLRGILAMCIAGAIWGYAQASSAGESPEHFQNTRKRYAARLTLALLVAIAGGWMTTDYLGERAVTALKTESETATSTLLNYIESELKGAAGASRALSGSPSIILSLASRTDKDIELANSVLDRYQEATGASVCYLMDHDGLVIASSNRAQADSFVGKNYAFRPYFRQAVSGQAAGEFAMGVTSGERGFYAAYFVRGAAGGIDGVVVIKKSISNLESAFAKYPYCFLIDPRGMVFLSSRHEILLSDLWHTREEPSKQHPGKTAAEPLLRKAPSNGMLAEVAGRLHLVTSKAISQPGWSIVLLAPADRVRSDRLIGILLTLSISVVLLGFYVGLQSLLESASRVSASEANYRALFNAANDALFVHDPRTGQILDVNLKMSDLYGYPLDATTDLTVEQLSADHPSCSREVAMDRICKAANGEPQLFEWMARDCSGNTFWVEVSLKLATISGRELVLAAVRDITERKEAQDALRESERQFREMLENVDLIALMLDRHGKVTFCNDFLLSSTGWKHHEIMGKNWFDTFIPPEKAADIREIFLHGLEHGTLPIHYENEIVARDGRRLTIAWSNTILRDAQGHIVGTTSIGSDITERMNLEKNLRQAQKMEALGTLAGGIAHDFNNILAVIVGYTEMAHWNVSESTPVRSHLQEVLNATQRAKELVQQILAFSRRSEHEKRPLEVGVIVKEALRMLRASLPSTIEMRADVASKAVSMVDPTQIHQVLMNLCTNAAHAMGEEEGVLDVSLSDVRLGDGSIPLHSDLSPGPYVMLAVKDTGHGIDPALLDRIFDPFFTTKGPGLGTGLGLSVVHGIVRSHGGAIEVDSLPGKGTSFRVFFPIVRTTPRSDPVAAPPSLHKGRERILVVDDEPALAMATQQLLEHYGYEVECRTSGAEALEAFRLRLGEAPFDLVLTDMTMPHLTGTELAHELHKLRPDLPVVLCTGFDGRMDAERARSIGICGFLMKPFACSELTGMIRAVLDKQAN